MNMLIVSRSDCASNSNLGMQLSPALQSPFSFHLGCGYARKKGKKSDPATPWRLFTCLWGP